MKLLMINLKIIKYPYQKYLNKHFKYILVFDIVQIRLI